MASLEYTDIQPGVFFRIDGTVYETVSSTFSKKSRQKGANQVRVRNIATGAVIAKTLHASDTPQKVDIDKKPYVFIYERNGEVMIHPEGEPSGRLSVPANSLVGINLMPSGTPVTALLADGKILTILPPVKVDLTVTDAPPGVRGNTSQGGTKKVTVETGATVTTPLFIETGDRIRVNTETGNYTERVEKNTD